MELLNRLWNSWLTMPLEALKQYTNIDWTQGGYAFTFKIAIVLLLLVILFESFLRVKRMAVRLYRKDDNPWEGHEVGFRRPSDTRLIEEIEAAKDLEGTVAALRKVKQYDRMADLYASMQKPREAAKWYQKAGDRKNAAVEWAKAGYPRKAAKMLLKEGDYAGAARCYEAADRPLDAAAMYLRLEDLPRAAQALGKAGKIDDAVRVFAEYFETSGDPPESQVHTAERCLALLESEIGREEVPPEARSVLLPALASCFEASRRVDLAAQLYYEGGQPEMAGKIYARIGKLQEAAKCFQEAGNMREANLTGARFFEAAHRWAEAGNAYAQGGEFLRAGDCFGKANETGKAAQCYERAGEFYGAGLAYFHLKKYEDAVRMLQKLKETDKMFDVSRALLGRCFHELHDYEHCAAALDNHLTGKRVETGNIEYFYMLALAYEQLGQLEKSRELLYKIHSVNVGFKDVTQRISNISSRISMGAGEKGATPTPISAMPTRQMPMMKAVEDMLGSRYRLERELGRGGMGTVYLALDTQLDRPVALKFLGAYVDDSESFRQRFVCEAKAAAKVNHPNIVHIYEISAIEGKSYIAMEYVEGMSLNGYLKKRGILPPREAVSIMIQACGALDAIHKEGIVHRDIKPDNILIAKGGLVKLTDFGLAKSDSARITESGVVMGTPAYMSPEQTRSSNVGPVSDIYSLGLVCYEMITGTVVFRGNDILARQQNETPPSPRTIIESIPESLDAIVMKCIQKDPEKRFQTAADLLEALRQKE